MKSLSTSSIIKPPVDASTGGRDLSDVLICIRRQLADEPESYVEDRAKDQYRDGPGELYRPADSRDDVVGYFVHLVTRCQKYEGRSCSTERVTLWNVVGGQLEPACHPRQGGKGEDEDDSPVETEFEVALPLEAVRDAL
ncbi:MAG: hypothetical protein UT32_C0013G0017 [Parcubacteria group bacterium GW2011_GWC2_39_14]|nr:MAG: hypothetical protein UT32_C0013G0017 [Parcubacteria group bacterium GW2011_GWC2_39_14]KKR54505.1 MAG: hypothetical protein UT91_C0014G0017 [Parcubacteria group bacterium GW2011_GWA2_40_23]